MVIYWVTGLSQTFCHSMKMKTTRIWVALANDAQKKELMVIRRYAMKPKSLQGGLE